MAFAILPALVPDIEKVYDVYFAAFKGDKMGNMMVDLLFPKGTDSEEFRKKHTADTLAWWNSCGVQYTYKCVDTTTGEIVGMALGDILFHERTEEERKFYSIPWLEDEQRQRADAVIKPLHEAREKLFGAHPHIYVHVIAIHPDHQGRQAGALWCKWGMDLSDSLGLPLYFEASPSTYKLYEKMGYETLEEKIVHSAHLMGTESPVEVPLMVKMPRAAGGISFRDWRAAGYPAFSRSQRIDKATERVVIAEVHDVKV